MKMSRKVSLLLSVVLIVIVSLALMSFLLRDNSRPIRILCLGDSLTESDYGNYPAILQQLLAAEEIGASVFSAARPGHTSGEYLAFLTSERPLERFKAQVAILMLGTNDTRIDGDATSRMRFYTQMKSIIQLIKQPYENETAPPIIYLCTVPPILNVDLPTFSSSSRLRIEQEINPTIRRLARETGCEIINLNRFFSKRTSLLPGIHPSPDGYRQMARFIFKQLDPLLRGYPSAKKEQLPDRFKGRIVFQSNRNGNEDIYQISAAGIKQLTTSPSLDGYPSVSPNGHSIYFESNRSGTFEIYNLTGSAPPVRLFTSPSEDRFPFCSSDGKNIYFARKIKGREQVFRFDLDSKVIEQITDYRGRNSLPAVAPSGDELMITVNRLMGWDVFRLNLVLGSMEKFSDKYRGCRARFSHSGTQITWVSHYFDKKGDIMITASDSFNPVRLTLVPDRRDYYPSFSPDDSYLVFASGPGPREGNHNLKIMDINTRKSWQITSTAAKDILPVWTYH